MKWSNVNLIYRKELLDITRDRRTVISMFVIPLIGFPLLIFGIGALVSKQVEQMQTQHYTILVIGADRARDFFEDLSENEEVSFQDFGDDEATARVLLEEDAISGVLVIPKEGLIPGEEPSCLRFLVDMSREKSEVVYEKVNDILRHQRHLMAENRLAEYDAPKSVLVPFKWERENIATGEQMGGRMLGMLLPYIMILLTLQGGVYAAIDLTAGEKEKATLETLLVSAASRIDIVLGKFFTVMTVSIISALISLISMTMVMVFGMAMLVGESAMSAELSFSINVGNTLLAGLMMIPLAAFFAALLLTICIFARSNREAQTYLMPLMLVVIVPALMSMLPGSELSMKMAWIPVVNVSLVIKEILIGDINPAMVGITFLSTVLYASAGIFVTMKVFEREEVLFKV